MSSLGWAWPPLVTSAIALAVLACKTSSQPEVEHNRSDPPKTGTAPGSSSAAPPATASPATLQPEGEHDRADPPKASVTPGASTFPPLDLVVDWPQPVKSRQMSPRSVVTSIDGFTLIINLADKAQTIDEYKRETLKDSDILPHENETIEPLKDGWSATFESADHYWVHVQRTIRGKTYVCSGARDTPPPATVIRFCKALR